MKQKSRVKLGIWIYVVVVCLGTLLPRTEVMATSVNQVSFSVSQIVEVEGIAPPEQEFEYVLEAMENENPLPQESEGNTYFFSLKGNQSIHLETLTFTEIGEYHYQLRLNKTDKAFTNDQEIYEITVYVTGSTDGLRAYAMAINKAGLKNEELSFVHRYEQPDKEQPDTPKPDTTQPTKPINPPSEGGSQMGGKTTTGAKTGDTAQLFLFVSMGIIALVLIGAVLMIKRKKEKQGQRIG